MIKKIKNNKKFIANALALVAVLCMFASLAIGVSAVSLISYAPAHNSIICAAPTVTEIVEVFTGAWAALAEGGGGAIQSGLKSLFLDDLGAMSFAGVLIICFSGISIGLGLMSFVIRKIR